VNKETLLKYLGIEINSEETEETHDHKEKAVIDFWHKRLEDARMWVIALNSSNFCFQISAII
jgi:hypothetical protein